MRILRHIELFLDGTYSTDDAKSFLISSRCICNYIEKSLAQLQFGSPYSRINIFCTKESHPASVRPYKHEPYLEVRIPLHATSLSSLSLAETHLQYSKAISLGIEAASTLTAIPTKQIAEFLKSFERGGYINQWEHLNKEWSRFNCRAIIAAEITTNNFIADQLVFIEDTLVARRRIVKCSPREGIFYEFLGKISINNQGIMEYKKRSKVLSAFDVQRQTFISPTPEIPHS